MDARRIAQQHRAQDHPQACQAMTFHGEDQRRPRPSTMSQELCHRSPTCTSPTTPRRVCTAVSSNIPQTPLARSGARNRKDQLTDCSHDVIRPLPGQSTVPPPQLVGSGQQSHTPQKKKDAYLSLIFRATAGSLPRTSGLTSDAAEMGERLSSFLP